MAIITNYSTLVQAIKDITENDDTEFAAYLPTAISLAEERLQKELDLYEITLKASGTLTVGEEILNKPAGRVIPYSFHITLPNGNRKLLAKKTDDFIVDYWPNPNMNEEPKYYADDSETAFVLAPTPDLPYTYVLRYFSPPQKLSADNPTNYYTQKAVDVLFLACLIETAKFMKAWNQKAVWEADYVSLRDSWNNEARRLRRDDGEVPLNSAGGQNTLIGTV